MLWTHSIRLHLYEYSMWIAPERPVLTGFEFLMRSLASSSVFLLTLKASGTRLPSCSQRAIESLPLRPGSA